MILRYDVRYVEEVWFFPHLDIQCQTTPQIGAMIQLTAWRCVIHH